MRIPQILIQTTNAQIGLTIPEPQQYIEQQPAELQIRQPAAELTIETTEGQLQIDQTQLRADLGMYTLPEFARNAAQKGRQMILQGIARRAREGEQLGDIRNGNNAIASIAASRNENMKQQQLGIKFVPSFGAVKLNYIPADVEIHVQTNKPKVDATIHKPIHQYTPGKVKVDLLQKPLVEIDWKV